MKTSNATRKSNGCGQGFTSSAVVEAVWETPIDIFEINRRNRRCDLTSPDQVVYRRKGGSFETRYCVGNTRNLAGWYRIGMVAKRLL